MRKLLSVFAVLAITTTAASAQHRGYGGHRDHNYNHNYSRNYVPWMAGAAALGILGAMTYDQYYRRCWRELVGYDYYGNAVTRLFCE